jgi:hypothetical protein
LHGKEKFEWNRHRTGTRRIVDNHNGFIIIASGAVDEGAFDIYVPFKMNKQRFETLD